MTKKKVSQLLDYLVTKPNAKVRLYVSIMVLSIHSDASYLSEPWSYSHISSNFFLGNTPIKGQPSAFNRAINVLWNFKICRGLSSGSWTSSPIFGLQGRKNSSHILEELNHKHKQPPILVHCDYITATCIANDTFKKQWSCSMEMQFFWITDQVKLGQFDVQGHPN